MSLTEKEERIVALVAAGMKNREIAAATGMTEFMVKNRLKVIYDKSGFNNRVQIALWYVRYREKTEVEVADGIDFEI